MQRAGATKRNIFLQLAAVLLLLVALTVCLLPNGLAARYVSSSTAGNSARVAKWEVEVTSAPEALAFNTSGTTVGTEAQSFVFSVSGDAEVAMQYTVTVSFDTAPPENVSLMLDGDQLVCDGTTVEYTFPSSYNRAVGAPENQHTLQILIDYTMNGRLVEVTDLPQRVEISVTAEQAD